MALDKPALAQGERDPFKIVFVLRWLLEHLTDFAPINNPVLTGDPKSVTPPPGDNDTSIATTAFTTAAIAAIPPQVCVGAAYAENNTYTSTSAAMAGVADTIPQQTDGVQLLTVTITPKSASNKLRVHAEGQFTTTGGTVVVWFALFQDSAAAAFSARSAGPGTVDISESFLMIAEIAAGTTSPTTIKLRTGNFNGVSQTIYVNGYSGGRFLGGAQRVTLSIEELAY